MRSATRQWAEDGFFMGCVAGLIIMIVILMGA
jgi:hypothetical protein